MNRILLSLVLLVTALGCSKSQEEIEHDLLTVTAKSVVRITSPASPNSGGTGFAVTDIFDAPLILTNGHVCAVAQNNYVAVYTHSKERHLRKVIRISDITDLCLVEGIKELTPINPQQFHRMTSRLYVVGHPFLLDTVLSSGYPIQKEERTRVLDTSRAPADCLAPKYAMEEIQVWIFIMKACVMTVEAVLSSAVIYPGNSGSPVLNANGEYIGIMFASDDQNHYGLFITEAQIDRFLKNM